MTAGHGHGHGHGHSDTPAPLGPVAAKVVVALLALIGLVVVVGAMLLWPGKQDTEIPIPFQSSGGGTVTTESGTILESGVGACGSTSAGKVFVGDPAPPDNQAYQCARSIVRVDSGPNAGTKTLLELSGGPGQPTLVAGQQVRLARGVDATGTTRYGFYDYERGTPLLLVALAFAVVTVLVARWRGLRALVGIGVAFAVLVVFLLPALVDGKPAVPVALVSGALILYAVLYLAHGVNLRTSSALLGTLASLGIAGLLSWSIIKFTTITGLSEEQNNQIQLYLEQVDISGLLLAGFIIGSLGVLNDVTITQASAAFELASLDPKASRRSLFTSTMRVGQDHIASTVYTLVLAYAGSALPLLLLFSVAGRSYSDVITGEVVAIEIARSAAGGIALALSVPITTGIAVMLARPPRRAG